ncbi:MAG: hypothetical protein KGL39_07845 [Patescibacteria group bacterium]|nr:hypothetical protein [Patescibacteria group bacterium]
MNSATIAKTSIAEKLILAAHQLEVAELSPFGLEMLIVAAWKAFPDTFGLKGCSDLFPDANRVIAALSGERGMVRAGLLVKEGQKLYSLTCDGRRRLRALLADARAGPAAHAGGGQSARAERRQTGCGRWRRVFH